MKRLKYLIVPKNGKYYVRDEKDDQVYIIKKKGFGNNRFVIVDKSGYQLYELRMDFSGKHPFFSIELNGKAYAKVKCKSLFLDPTIIANTPEGDFWLKTSDRKNFIIYKDEKATTEVGSIGFLQMIEDAPQMSMEIEDIYFDAYTPMFALCAAYSFIIERK